MPGKGLFISRARQRLQLPRVSPPAATRKLLFEGFPSHGSHLFLCVPFPGGFVSWQFRESPSGLTWARPQSPATPVPRAGASRRKGFSMVSPAAPPLHLMSPVLPHRLTGKTHSRVTLSSLLASSPLLSSFPERPFHVPERFRLCPPPCSRCSRELWRSERRECTGILGTLGQSRACLITQSREYTLGSTCAAAEPAGGASSTVPLRASNEERRVLLESFLPDPTREASGVVWELLEPTLWPIQMGMTRRGEMKSVRVHKEAKRSPASAQSSRSAVS